MCCLVLVNFENLTFLTGHFLGPEPFGTIPASCQRDVLLAALSDKLGLVRQRHSAGVACAVRFLRPGA